jgi:hypothetical protein
MKEVIINSTDIRNTQRSCTLHLFHILHDEKLELSIYYVSEIFNFPSYIFVCLFLCFFVMVDCLVDCNLFVAENVL